MQRKELEEIMVKLCGDAPGIATRFAKRIGVTSATISRWRNGLTPVKERDAQFLRMLVSRELKGVEDIL